MLRHLSDVFRGTHIWKTVQIDLLCMHHQYGRFEFRQYIYLAFGKLCNRKAARPLTGRLWSFRRMAIPVGATGPLIGNQPRQQEVFGDAVERYSVCATTVPVS
jgi:hypothetical protein